MTLVIVESDRPRGWPSSGERMSTRSTSVGR